jgi:uncharacterized integral membrane protein
MNKLLTVVIPAVLVIAIAILSVQNATPIQLSFLAFRSVALPFGVWLGFCLALGMVGTAVWLTLSAKKPRRG